MKLESEKLVYVIENKKDEERMYLIIKKRVKDIVADGYCFCGISKEWPGKNTLAIRLVYQRVFERKVLVEKNKNVSEKELKNEMHNNISMHCSEKRNEERRQEQIEKMMSKSLYSNSLLDELLSGKIFTEGIPAGQITLLMGKRND